MHTVEIVEEKIRFGPADSLAGVLSYPAEGVAEFAALICSPHPNFGGDLDNNVVAALAQRLSAEAIVLRFNYRGVGGSRIDLPAMLSVFDYWEQIEETLDYVAPLADTRAAVDELACICGNRPIVATGYSFGAIMATQVGVADSRIRAMAGIAPPLKRVGFSFLVQCPKPTLLISGIDDFVTDPTVADRLADLGGSHLTMLRPKADHFYIGREGEVADNVENFLAGAIGARKESARAGA